MGSIPAHARAAWRRGSGWLLTGLCLCGTGVLACRPSAPDSTGADWEQLGAALSGAKIEPGVSGALALITVTRQEVDLCTATLLAPNLVATARHCVAPTSADSVSCADDPGAFAAPYSVNSLWVNHASTLSGSLQSFGRLPMTGGSDEFVPVAAVFVPDTDDVCGGDLALLLLSEELPATEAAPLAPSLDDPVKRNDPYTAVGFGDTPDASGQGTRRSRTGLEVSCAPEDCDAPGNIEPTEFQGGDGVCSGDSGGPALDARGRVVGIASRSVNCTGSVYSAVSGWREFIRDVAGRAARAGSYPAPEWLVPEPPPEPEPPVSEPPAAATPPEQTATDPAPSAPEGATAPDLPDVGKHPIAASDASGGGCSVARPRSERRLSLALLLGGCLGALALRHAQRRRRGSQMT
jgi:hypothetical protein